MTDKTTQPRVLIFDTTLRDGEQSPGATMTHADGRVQQGYGVMEQLLIGPYAPLGLAGMLDPMP